MIVTRFGISPAPWPGETSFSDGLAISTPATVHRVQISHLSDENLARLRNLLAEVSKQMVDAPNWKIIKVRMNSGRVYYRRAPGAAKLEPVLGPEFFRMFSALLDTGIQAYEDSRRTDLGGAQKLGRTSLALLAGVVPPLGLVLLGAKILFPTATDNFTAALFSTRDPLVDALANAIVWAGGRRFREWSTKPSWIDYF